MARPKSEFLSALGIMWQVWKALTDEVLNLGGSDGDLRRIETDGGLRRKIAELIVGANQAASSFKVWKTIKLGTGPKTADGFCQALKKAGHRIGNLANDILGQCAFRVADRETEVDLVVVSVAELGFPNGATRQDIYRRAQELGLELCPAEVGPQLRLQYPDQPNGEWLLIGMEPIAGSRDFLRVFRVERGDGGSWLYSYYGYPGRFWSGDGRWVFLRRK